MDILKDFEKTVKEHLSLCSSPVAVKLLEREEDIPSGAGRPLRDTGETIRPCVGWHLARHRGFSIAMLADDFGTDCPTGLFVFGISEPTRSWLEGGLSYGIYTASTEAAANMERHVYRLEPGRYVGVAFAPLRQAPFAPDLIMIYSNGNDARRLALASAWETGEPLKVSIAGRNLCAESIAQLVCTGKPVFAIPCGGDRQHGGTQDDEVVFAAPVNRLAGIIEGLKGAEKAHHVKSLGAQSWLRKSYRKMAEELNEKLGRGRSGVGG